MEQLTAIYQAPNGAIQLRPDSNHETVWANQSQIADIFGIDRTVVTKHINNIFKDKEIDAKRNVQILHIANSDKPVKFYNLDIILSVGYRTKSSLAIKFRQRATQTLKQHITQGFTINPERIHHNHQLFLKAVDDIKILVQRNDAIQTQDILDLIKNFSYTWFSLDRYDKGSFPLYGSKQEVDITVQELYHDLAQLKSDLIMK